MATNVIQLSFGIKLIMFILTFMLNILFTSHPYLMLSILFIPMTLYPNICTDIPRNSTSKTKLKLYIYIVHA